MTTYVVPHYFSNRLPFHVEFGLTWQATLQGFGIGLLVALLFSVLPLLEIRQIKPVLVLRHDLAPGKRRVDWMRLGVGLAQRHADGRQPLP